jgi:glycosyltransferase involved in cell wall biosynthesis
VRDGLIVMLGPALEARGGVSAVMRLYRRGGLFDRWPIVHIPTQIDRRPRDKLRLAVVACARYSRLLATGRMAVLHVHGASGWSFRRKLPFMLAAFALHRPVIFHLHGGGFLEFYDRHCDQVQRGLVRLVLRRAARVVLLSSEWEEPIRGIEPAARVLTIPNPVILPDLGDVASSRRKPTIAFLGRLEAEKGIYDLLEATHLVQQRVPETRLVCGGEGDMANVQRRAAQLGLASSVDCLGWIDEDARSVLLATSTVFALPSYYEALPMAVLEAMAAELPVVATRVGGLPSLITEGEEGFLVPPGDVPGLAESLGKVLADPTLARALGRRARERVRAAFSAATVLPRLEALYGELGVRPLAGPPGSEGGSRAEFPRRQSRAREG